MKLNLLVIRHCCIQTLNLTRNIVYYTPLYDFNGMQFVQHYLRPGDAFFRYRCQYWSLYFVSVLDYRHLGACICSLNPFLKLLNALKENIAHNNLEQVKVLFNGGGFGRWKHQFYPLYRGDSVSHISASSDSPHSTKIQVPLPALRWGFRKIDPYAMAKIDVEGAELRSFKGSISASIKTKPSCFDVRNKWCTSPLWRKNAGYSELSQ